MTVTKADLLLESCSFPLREIFGDAGVVPLGANLDDLSGYSNEVEFDFQHGFEAAEARALNWRTAYMRTMLSQLAPAYVSALDALLTAPIMTAFSAMDSSIRQPWGQIGLLAALLQALGYMPIDDGRTFGYLLGEDLHAIESEYGL